MLLDIQHSYGLGMKTSSGLGCTSFPSGLLTATSMKLTWLQREGKKGGENQDRLPLLNQPWTSQAPVQPPFPSSAEI